MEDREFAKYLDEKYEEIPKDFLAQCVEFLRNDMPQETKDEIIKAHQEKGSNWIVDYHFGWGMNIRNLLRSNGLTDDQLPDKNWDDYYAQVVEAAVGLR
jgi:hypothetical protein